MATLCQHKERLVRSPSYISDIVNCGNHIVLFPESHSTDRIPGSFKMGKRKLLEFVV